MTKRVGYLLVGHGTRNIAGQQQFRKVFAQFAERIWPELAELAFLELAAPNIATAVGQLAAQGATHVVTVPVLLFAAGHAVRDIPIAVAQAAQQCGLKCVGQASPFELSPQVLELSAFRFRQAVCQAASTPSCIERCEGRRCPQIGLALIGRGSRSDEATERMRQFALLRRHITPVAQLEVGFVFAQSPTVEECLQRMADSDCNTVVIQPHLLFEGELVEQLRGQVADFATRYSRQHWLITETIGTDFAHGKSLADSLTTLARQVVDCGESG
ncbi:MAG: sirohydrochlorin chelatase [Pirellulaceae bacterium]